MYKRLLSVGVALIVASGPALSAETVDEETLRDIVEMYIKDFKQSSEQTAPLHDPAEIRPGGWTDKWDAKAEKSIEAHRKQILERTTTSAAVAPVPKLAVSTGTVDRETLREIVKMYVKDFKQSSDQTIPVRDSAEIRPGGWTDKWDEEAERSIEVHRNQILSGVTS